MYTENIIGSSISDENMCLPTIYAIPKLHKSPYKFRFIASATKCSTKPISLLLLSILKKFTSHFKNYCNKIEHTARYNPYWPIDNSIAVLHKFSSNKQLQHATHIEAFDFSTLFPSLPHTEIKQSLHWLTDFLFKNSGKSFMAVSPFQSFYCDTSPTHSTYALFNSSQVKELINFVIDETYVSFADHIFRAHCGVPQGGNASPLIATLTLTVMEFKFYQIEANRKLLKNSLYFCRYIDDLLVVNCPNFLTIARKIYPISLPLTSASSTSNNHSCNFLDLSISISPFSISVYNKTDDFNFEVQRYVYIDSNVSPSLGYNVFVAQVIRFGRICTSFPEFLSKCHELSLTFVSHGYSKQLLLRSFISCLKKHSMILSKYGVYTPSDIFKMGKNLIS